MITYQAFIEGELDVPKHLARHVHDCYFQPQYEEFQPRTLWSLSNVFTPVFKELDPIPQFQATAQLGCFFEACFKQSFRQGWAGPVTSDLAGRPELNEGSRMSAIDD